MNAAPNKFEAPDGAVPIRLRHAEILRRPGLPATLPAALGRIAVLRAYLLHHAIEWVSRRIVQGANDRGELEFKVVRERRDWTAVCALRREVYATTIPYMLSVLDPTGADEYDHRSVVFGVWLRGRPVATVRYTQWPFEVTRYVPTTTLAGSIPLEACDKTLEFSRLLVASDAGVNRLMPALITYSGLMILFNTSFRRYVGYAKMSVVRKLNSFHCETGPQAFRIPERGDHQYELVIGEFLNDARHFIKRTFRFAPVVTALTCLLPRS
ncbi:hypothetical protein [Paraburkholderia kururiensis]|uniref:hypothetical protein n=1 Tax=Paraburkholderia kururiensis TaxID=984307 RepID=UPI000F861297|nr:hypothetical protein [Paraburkholderia kururiensis]